MSSEDRDDYLLMPLRGIRDYGKPVDASFLENAPEPPPKTKEELEAERDASAELARSAAMQNMGTEAEVLDAPTASGIDVDFSSKEKRGVVIKLCRIERFVRDVDTEVVTHLFHYMCGASFGSLATSSKNLYMRVKNTAFLLNMTLKGFAKLSSNIRRGIGHGMVQNCRLSVGTTDERCGISTVNSMAAFLTSAYPAKVTLESFTMQADESTNDVAIHGILAAVNNKHANNIVNLSFEGTGIQFKGLSLFCDIMRKGPLKKLQRLNISRNKCLYQGVHKLSKVIGEGKVPNIEYLDISNNDAKHAILDFFDRSFSDATPNLKHFIAQSNLFDIYDPDTVAQRLRGRGKLLWTNFHTLDLSRNLLVDVEFAKMLREQVWCLEDQPVNKKTGAFTHPCQLRTLLLNEVEMGNHTMQVMSDLAVKGFFPQLKVLDVSGNFLDRQGTDFLLEPLRREQWKELTHLNMSLNKIYHDGMLMVASSQNLGVFDNLEELDISDVGVNAETIQLFAKSIVARFEKGMLVNMLRLRVFGRNPFAGKSARLMFPEEFLTKIKVS